MPIDGIYHKVDLIKIITILQRVAINDSESFASYFSYTKSSNQIEVGAYVYADKILAKRLIKKNMRATASFSVVVNT